MPLGKTTRIPRSNDDDQDDDDSWEDEDLTESTQDQEPLDNDLDNLSPHGFDAEMDPDLQAAFDEAAAQDSKGFAQLRRNRLGKDNTGFSKGSFMAGGPSVADDENPEWSPNEIRMLRYHLIQSHLAFCRYFLQKRDQNRFILSPHHVVMANALEQVISGNIRRLIINVPPGYTKTEMAVIMFIARGLAVNPRSKFIHISYADNLAMLNSSVTKDLIVSPEYQQLWPMDLKADSKSKAAWYNKWNGGMMAVSSGGTITGFRAGRMMEAFSGALIIDDPIKPDDAYSETVRNRVNGRFTNTFKSRLAHEGVPIIVIMQRIHDDDPTAFLLRGGTGEMWHHLELPVEIKPKVEREKYPSDFTHGIPLEYDLPEGPLWEYKHGMAEIELMRSSDPYTTSAQYDQRPSPLGGGMFKDEWWQYYKGVAPVCEYRFITADTASKTKEHNDFSCFQHWGYLNGNLYLLDLIKGKWAAPELRRQAHAFWIKHFGSGNQTVSRLRYMAVEDKSSGTGLIQDLVADIEPPIPIMAIQRNKDKVQRAMDMIPYFASKRLYLDETAPYLSDYLREFSSFTPLMTHRHDDQIDPTLDAVDLALRPANLKGGTW